MCWEDDTGSQVSHQRNRAKPRVIQLRSSRLVLVMFHNGLLTAVHASCSRLFRHWLGAQALQLCRSRLRGRRWNRRQARRLLVLPASNCQQHSDSKQGQATLSDLPMLCRFHSSSSPQWQDLGAAGRAFMPNFMDIQDTSTSSLWSERSIGKHSPPRTLRRAQKRHASGLLLLQLLTLSSALRAGRRPVPMSRRGSKLLAGAREPRHQMTAASGSCPTPAGRVQRPAAGVRRTTLRVALD